MFGQADSHARNRSFLEEKLEGHQTTDSWQEASSHGQIKIQVCYQCLIDYLDGESTSLRHRFAHIASEEELSQEVC